ncbi:PACE efflux transporter [Photobacterium sagamiensis]|uniref:PACE efflux transporter n=1 Tax=Photobacterium sagamiensis TaxID=2910241 RepID=UPI003D0E9E61
MRTTYDRIRHAIGFELIALMLIMLGFSLLMDFEVHKIGLLGLAFSVFTTGWNFVYNILFDKAMMKCTGQTGKAFKHRIIHALVFEVTLLWLTLPVMAWFLEISLLEALIMDLGLVVFYLFYTYGYNWAYDQLFPTQQPLPLS